MEQLPFDVNNPEIRHHFLAYTLMDAIQRLKEQSRPLWGRMTAQQMVEHLIWSLELSTGKSEIICNLPVGLLEKRKKFLFDNMPTPQEVPNPELEKGLPPNRFASLDEAIRRLGEELSAFRNFLSGNTGIEYEHPIFGKLSAEEWERAHYKHVYHHLLQFGLIHDPGCKD